jgi:hypothetical protein
MNIGLLVSGLIASCGLVSKAEGKVTFILLKSATWQGAGRFDIVAMCGKGVSFEWEKRWIE